MKNILFLLAFWAVFAVSARAEDVPNNTNSSSCYYSEIAWSEFSLAVKSSDKTKANDFCALHPATAASKWVKLLNDGTQEYDVVMKFVYYELDRGALKLYDIGITKAELERLTNVNAKMAANVWYEHLLHHPDNYEVALRSINEHALRGGFRASDIGDPLKIKQLTLHGARIVAERCLAKMRESGNTDDIAAKCVVRQARIGGYSFANLGTDFIEVGYRGAREPKHPVSLLGPKGPEELMD